jgi:5-methylcytosine-specific restriction endonuclease McrA
MAKPPIGTIQKRDNYICQYCGKDGLESLDNWHDNTVDHFRPRKYGGTDDSENLVTSCGYCNSIKGDQLFGSPEECKAYILKRRAELQITFEAVKKAVRG